MGFFNNFPYTNFHEMNLDWLINAFNELKSYVEQYTAVNNVSYAGVWNITNQYPQWSIVVDGDNSYLAKQAVPSGIAIDNVKYWLHMADLDPRIGAIINSINNLDGRVDNLDGKVANLENDLNNKLSKNAILDLTEFDGEDLNQHYTGDFNGIVLLPKTAILSHTITISTPCYILGFNSVINSATANCLTIGVDECFINGVFFNYNGETVDPDSANNSAIAIDGKRVAVKNCRFELFPSSAVSVGGENIVIENCLIQNLKSSTIAALWFGHSSKRCTIRNCKIVNNYLDGAHVEGKDITFDSCTISKNGLRPSTGSGAIGACGIYGGQEDADRPISLVVTGCSITGNSESGIDCGSGSGRFVNNDISGNALNGIRLGSNYINVISNNVFAGNGNYSGNVDAYRKAAIGSNLGAFSLIATNNYIRGSSREINYVDFSTTEGNNQIFMGNMSENGKEYSTITDSSVLIVNNVKN